MEKIYLLLNETTRYTLEVDKQTGDQLLKNEHVRRSYIHQLLNQDIIQVEGGTLNRIQASKNDIFESAEDVAVCDVADVEERDTDALWSEGSTRLLLDKYNQYLVNVGPLKKFKKKKQMWEQIAKDIKSILQIQKTSLQCENRFKTVMKRKKKGADQNRRTGEEPAVVEFEEELEKIKSIDDSVEPEVLMGTDKCVVNKKEPSSSATTNKLQKKGSIGEVLENLHKEREEARKRRHNEKMTLLREIGAKLGNNNNINNIN